MFWSYVVLDSNTRARAILSQLRSHGNNPRFLHLIKVISLPRRLEPQPEEHQCLVLLRCLSKLAHIHLHSDPPVPTCPLLLASLSMRFIVKGSFVQGLTGVVLGDGNFEAAMLALTQLAPSLRRLAICTVDVKPSHPAKIRHHISDLPQLVSLSTRGPGPTWLEDAFNCRWDMPALTKVSIGRRLVLGSAIPKFSQTYDSVFISTLREVGWRFPRLATLQPQELGFQIGSDQEDGRLDLEVFKSDLGRAVEPELGSVKVIVIAEGVHPRLLEDGYDLCLVELVNRHRFPSLEKVVWIAAKKDDDGANWST